MKFRYFIPSCIIMIIIFSFSQQTGEQSGGFSLQIIHYIQDILPFLSNTDLLHTIIRKCAHMSEYALLTITFIYGFYKNRINLNIICLNSLIFTFLYACSDELHQLFVGGRAGNFTDVLIDTIGGFVVIVIYYFLRRKKDGIQNKSIK